MTDPARILIRESAAERSAAATLYRVDEPTFEWVWIYMTWDFPTPNGISVGANAPAVLLLQNLADMQDHYLDEYF